MLRSSEVLHLLGQALPEHQDSAGLLGVLTGLLAQCVQEEANPPVLTLRPIEPPQGVVVIPSMALQE